MSANSRQANSATSWPASFAGAALFLLWGLVLIGFELPHEWAIPTWIQSLLGILWVFSLVLPAIAWYVGWIERFPRWSYPYVGHLLVFSLYMTHVATPGLHFFGYPIFGRNVWGWRAWILPAAATLTALLVTRSLHPLSRLFTNIWQDWTLLTFGMSGFLPLLVAISFDEVDRLYSLYFMVIVAFLTTGMALIYMRSERGLHRRWTLLAGIIPTTVIAALAPNFYWQQKGEVNFLPAEIAGAVVVLIMFSPAAIGFLHRMIAMRQAD